ncbi:adhesion G protein-coupled receptor E5 isoform X2 [Triplophysa rosa]|uniref:adhesion G protein-coupled receptor E5 isoform X2 n=1 Tax=Triplophysa rosa TaxID=992332 RepID=UPI002545FC86|nr:adhesion G protein-coupled receptor E5 isoform X2 [Triplophysa rosa]
MERKQTLLLGLLLLFGGSHGCQIGFKSNKSICVDENECEMTPNMCGNNAMCINTNGSYYCNCENGFRSKTLNFTATTGQCEDENECLGVQSPCPDTLKCINTIGSFECLCPTGYGKKTDKNMECEDIDECKASADLCGTHATCNNSLGSYSCRCDPGYSNYGNNQSKCLEIKCEQFNRESGLEATPMKMKSLLSLLKDACKTLTDPDGDHHKGEVLLENLFTSTNELLSDGDIADGGMLSRFLDAVENSMRLIGPQLREPLTRMETHSTHAEVAVRRGQSRPNGSVSLSTDSALFNTSWETVVGESYPGFAFVALVSYKDLNSSGDSFNKMSRTLQEESGERNITYRLNANVVTAVVSNPETTHLSEPVTLVFKHVQERAESKDMTHTCVYWDETEVAWSGRGCKKAWTNSTHTACSCTHLSSFAVLMALYPVKDTFGLVMITRVGLILSLVCLLLCILTFRFCRSIQGTRNSIHLHLSVCLFIADLVFLCGISSTHNRVACSVVAGLLHFFFLAAFCWMLLEGVQLYRMVVLVFHTTIKHLYMYMLGYGVPLLIVIISAAAYPRGYGTDRHCWLSLKEDFIWSFFAPVCIVIILNCFFFIVTVWKLAEKFSSLNPDLSNLHKIRSFTVAAVAQLCVLGGMWIFGCFLFQEKGTVVLLYLFTILNSLQGALIFFMHCLLSKAVREEYCNLINRLRSRKEKKYSEFSSNQSSNSQQPLRSDQNTGESKI